MKRALVFAGHSFVGRWLIRELQQHGWTTVNAVRRTAADGDLSCDLFDANRIEEVIAQTAPTWIFQCGGATTGNDPRATFNLHVTGTFNVLDAVRRHAPAAGVMLMGSAAEYGNTNAADFPIREDHPGTPCSFFGASKAAQTQLAHVAALEWGLRLVTVRPFNVIGPGLPAHYFAAALAARMRQPIARASCEVQILNANATRDFVDVRDLAEGLVGLAETGEPKSGEAVVYNIATGFETSLMTMAEELGRLAGGIVPVPGGESSSRGGSTRSCGDASRLRLAIGWKPRRSWQESLQDMWTMQESLCNAA